MQPTDLVNDPDILAFAGAIQNAPMPDAVKLEAAASPELAGNFADRDPVLSQNDVTPEVALNIQPPTIG